MSEQPVSPEVTSDDKLWAALAYAIPVVIPVVILLMEDKKNRPFIKSNGVQALILGLIFYVTVGFCLGFLVYLYMLYCAYQAYQGNNVTIPVLTDFVKNQGWA